MNPWWSVILTVIGAFGMWLTARKLWWGFAVGLGAQGLWVAYAVATGQWGFIGSALLYGSVYAYGLRRWFREASPVDG